MNRKLLIDPPDTAEIDSFKRSFSGWPWYESIDHMEAASYLSSFRGNGFAWSFHDKLQHPAYLYLHGRVYDNVAELIADEFMGPQAFYVAKEPQVIEHALAEHQRICFISNIHADKTVPISVAYKPRLKILPPTISELLQTSGGQAVAYFTHLSTAVHDYNAGHPAMQGYKIIRTVYDILPRAEANGIEQLILFVVSRSVKPLTS